jgi:hypothetical protein
MKKRRMDTPAFELDETSRTGHHCPKTGWWSAAGDPAAARFLTKGEVMPAACGEPVLWVLGKAAGSPSPRAVPVLAPNH